MNINIASWNINSIRARETSLQNGLSTQPGYNWTQETKVIDDQFPEEFFYKMDLTSDFSAKKLQRVCLLLKEVVN